MDLDQLRNIEDLSVRAYNVCRTSNLRSLELILNWYKKHGYFKNIRNCGSDTNKELTIICIKYILHETASLTGEKKFGLRLVNAVSVRAYNVCLYNELSSVESLIEYYKRHGSFSKFRNCGLKTNMELIDFCKGNIDSFSKDEQLQELEPFLIENFSRLQQRVIRYHYYSLRRNLPSSIFRALSDFLGGYLSMEKNMFDKILNNPSFNLGYFDFLGGNAIEKLGYFIKSYKDTVRSVSEISGKEELINFNFRLTLNFFFPHSLLYNKLRANTIFCAMQVAIENELLFDKNILKVFKNKFKIYNNLPIEFSNDNNNLSRERIRQICKIIQEDLYKKTRFIKRLIDETLDKYDLFPDSDVIFIDQLLNEKINIVNQTDFSKEWNSYLIYVYFSHSFELIGLVEDVLFRKNQNTNGRHNWSCFYIVNNDATEVFDFLLLVNDFKLVLDSSRINSIYFNINNYVSEKLNISNSDDILRISKIARFIIKHEFGLGCDENGNFLLQKNTRMPLHECAFDALIVIDFPSTVSEILEKIVELFPDIRTDENRVRAVLKIKHGFVGWHVASNITLPKVFGLSQWETGLKGAEDFIIGLWPYKRQMFKPIVEIVSDCLGFLPMALPMKFMTALVNKHLPGTSRRNVWDNLKHDASGVFVFMKGANLGYIGLKSKDYFSDEPFEKGISEEYFVDKIKAWQAKYPNGETRNLVRKVRYQLIFYKEIIRDTLANSGAPDTAGTKSYGAKLSVADEFSITRPPIRSSIVIDIVKYEIIIYKILCDSPGQIASKESLKEELVKISKLDSLSLDNILNKASYLKRRLCMAGRPFYYYHTFSDILDISRDYNNIQDFILTDLRTADFRLEYYYKAMQKMIHTPDPEIITGAIGRLISLGKISQFYHKFVDNDSEILMPNRMRAILDNLIMGICESMANRRDISFMMDRAVYNNKFINDFVSYLSICGVVQLNLYEIKIEIVYLINYNGDKVLLKNNIEALFLPFVLKNYFVANKMKCEFMVLGFNVKYINRYNLISYE